MMNKIFAFVVLLIAFSACQNEKNVDFTHISPNGKVKVNVVAKRATTVESWKVILSVDAYNFDKGSLSFEIYAKDISAKNVVFDWTDEHHCIIKFIEQDDGIRKFQLIASPSQLQLMEI